MIAFVQKSSIHCPSMPATRITVALNSKQSSKAPLLIPASTPYDPSAASSCRSLVIKTAQSKLRLKKVSRIFTAKTGEELESEDDWKGALRDDVVLLVSAGEDYVGAKKEAIVKEEVASIKSLNLNLKPTINILANKAFIDPQSVTQLETTAHTLPGIVHAVAQPDLHPGNRFPIGAVFVSEGWIHPPLIGGDIGCGMAWYKTKLSASQVEGDKGRKVAEKLRGLEGAWGTQANRLAWLTKNLSNGSSETDSLSAGEAWDASLGTIGAGNHFAEVQVVEEVVPGDWQDRNTNGARGMLHEGEVVLLVHSGSRGYGGDILKRYTADNQTSMPITDSQASAYLLEHDRACGWASRNRDLIALRFLACLEPGEEMWNLGNNDTTSSASRQDIWEAWKAIQGRKVVDLCHNNVERISWPPQPPSSTNSDFPCKEAFIHRKGAAPVYRPSFTATSQSERSSRPYTLLPLPGSRSTPTLILSPILNAANSFGLSNALSVAHGAGRAMSRAKALTYLASKYDGRADDILRGDFVKINRKGNKSTANPGDRSVASRATSALHSSPTHADRATSEAVDESNPSPTEVIDGASASEPNPLDTEISNASVKARSITTGTWVVCEDKALVWEEAAEAYKDVWNVGEDLVEKGAVKWVGWCWGRVSYKVRKE